MQSDLNLRLVHILACTFSDVAASRIKFGVFKDIECSEFNFYNLEPRILSSKKSYLVSLVE